MLDKLSAIDARYEEIAGQLYDPAIISNQDLYRSLMKEHKQLSPLVEKYRNFSSLLSQRDEAKALLDAPDTDRELKELAEEEYLETKAAIEQTEADLKLLLLPKDPNDDKNVIVEIRAGTGGEEAALFAGSLFRMYTMYAEAKRFKIEVAYLSETELGGYKEISFVIEGEGAYSRLKFESGVHRVQRVPETETQGRIHTSAVTVAVLPEAEEVELEINPADLQIDTFRSSGAGGQKVNKTESAIRVIHLPTGTVVECQDERSQHKNKDKALRILRSRIYEKLAQEQSDKIASDRKMQVGSGDRSERIRTYNFPQGRVTDHRIGLTLYKIDAILNGDLDEIIDGLITAERAKALSQGET